VSNPCRQIYAVVKLKDRRWGGGLHKLQRHLHVGRTSNVHWTNAHGLPLNKRRLFLPICTKTDNKNAANSHLTVNLATLQTSFDAQSSSPFITAAWAILEDFLIAIWYHQKKFPKLRLQNAPIKREYWMCKHDHKMLKYCTNISTLSTIMPQCSVASSRAS
jgi:hypothetical protein